MCVLCGCVDCIVVIIGVDMVEMSYRLDRYVDM